MAPTPKQFDYIVIGGGSGGSGGARRAAGWYKAKTLIIENGRSGGTCVNVGCVPKKMTVLMASVNETLKHGKHYGYEIPENIPIHFEVFKKKRDERIRRLNGAYESNWNREGIELVQGTAHFKSPKEVEVDLADGSGKQVFTAPHILIATGGYPHVPEDVEGSEHGITSDGFFDIEHLPKKMGFVGAGYIAVEMAGMMHALGVECHMFIRHDTFLRKFDPMIQEVVTKRYEDVGIKIHKGFKAFKKIERLDDAPGSSGKHDTAEKYASGPSPDKVLKCTTVDGEVFELNELLWAVGRKPEIKALDPMSVGVKLNDRGYIHVDDFQNTSVDGIYALGDVTGQIELTPVAIAAGRQLGNRLFGPPHMNKARLDYTNVPSVVFSHPECGSIGLTEPEAVEKFGKDNLKIYTTSFTPMFFDIMPQEIKAENPTKYKLICAGEGQKVVGLHIIGDASSEILQGFGVAIKMGATKADFDSCVAIHPTSAEELVTLK